MRCVTSANPTLHRLLQALGKFVTLTLTHSRQVGKRDVMLRPSGRPLARSKFDHHLLGVERRSRDSEQVAQQRAYVAPAGPDLLKPCTAISMASLLKLMCLTVLSNHAANWARERSDWSDVASPAKIAKCKGLSRYPTSEAIAPYSASSMAWLRPLTMLRPRTGYTRLHERDGISQSTAAQCCFQSPAVQPSRALSCSPFTCIIT